MLLVILISLIILSFTFWLHYRQHFELKTCTKKQRKSTNDRNGENSDKSTPRKQSNSTQSTYLCSLLIPKEEESYNFFPISFLYYLVFLIFISLFITLRQIMCYYDKYHYLNPKILFSYSLQIHHQYLPFLRLHSIHLSDISSLTGSDIVVRISDYILIYSVLLLLLWESLFSFHKYMTAQGFGQYLMISRQEIILKFMVYGVLFALIFNIQIHFYYYLWPILLMLHSFFNLICCLKFSRKLIRLCHLFMTLGNNYTDENETILQSVYSMRRISMICIVLQSIYLSLFTFSYTVHTICYLPIVWSLSCLTYSFTFVRNRKYLSYKFFQFKQIMKYETPFSHSESIRTEKKQKGSSMSEASKHAKFSDVDIPQTKTTVFSDVQIPPKFEDTQKRISPNRSLKSSNSSKALKLLGLSTGLGNSNKSSRLKHLPPRIIVESQSDIVLSPTGEYDARNSQMRPRQISYSKSDTIHGKHTETIVAILPTIADKENEGESQTMSSYMPKLPLRRISSPSIPIEFINNEDIDSISSDDDEDDEDSGECVLVEYNANNIDDEFEEPQIEDQQMKIEDLRVDIGFRNKSFAANSNNLKPPSLKHRRSNSDPSGTPNAVLLNMDIDEVINSLNLFSKYGFCSRNSINSLYQLTQYRNKITQMAHHCSQQTK